MIDAREEAELTNGGDTQLHHHLADRVTQDQLQSAERIGWPTAAFGVDKEDYVFADTTGGAFAVTLPLVKFGRIITVVRVAGGSNLTVIPTGSNTINGAGSLVISTSYSPRRLKGVPGIGYIEV